MKRLLIADGAEGGGAPSPTPTAPSAEDKRIAGLEKQLKALTAQNAEYRERIEGKDKETLGLLGEFKALKAENAALKEAKSQNDADESLIMAKMARGLSRAQAINIITRQREFEKDNPKRAPKAEKKS